MRPRVYRRPSRTAYLTRDGDHELASHHGDGAALRVTVQRDARFFARAERRDDFWRDFDAGRDFAALQDGHREFY